MSLLSFVDPGLVFPTRSLEKAYSEEKRPEKTPGQRLGFCLSSAPCQLLLSPGSENHAADTGSARGSDPTALLELYTCQLLLEKGQKANVRDGIISACASVSLLVKPVISEKGSENRLQDSF